MKKLLFILPAVMLLGSCGGGSDKSQGNITVTVKPDKTVVSGALGDYLEVEDGPYSMTEDAGNLLHDASVSIKIRAKQKASDDFIKDIGSLSLTLSVLDANGSPISAVKSFGSQDEAKIMALIKKGSGDDIINFTNLYGLKDQGDAIKKFAVSSEVQQGGNASADNSSTVSGDSATGTASDADVDAMINSYGEFIDKYVELMKKAKNGDQSVVSDYTDAMQKAQEVQQKLDKVKGTMTQDQMQKLLKLETKMANAAAEMSK